MNINSHGSDIIKRDQAPPGVGDPIDSINLALAFFEKHNVRVIGAVINRISLTAANVRHTFEDCQKYVCCVDPYRKAFLIMALSDSIMDAGDDVLPC